MLKFDPIEYDTCRYSLNVTIEDLRDYVIVLQVRHIGAQLVDNMSPEARYQEKVAYYKVRTNTI